MTTSLIRESIGSPRRDLERVLAIVGGDDRIAVARQRPLGDAADHRLVLDQQHGAAAPQLVLLGLPTCAAWPRGLLAVTGR
jgi:hypothetical protein